MFSQSSIAFAILSSARTEQCNFIGGSSNASAAADNWLGNFYAEQGLTLDEAGKAHWEKDIKGGATRQDVKNNILKILGKL